MKAIILGMETNVSDFIIEKCFNNLDESKK